MPKFQTSLTSRQQQEILEGLGRMLLTENDQRQALQVLQRYQDQAGELIRLASRTKVMTLVNSNFTLLSKRWTGCVISDLFNQAQSEVIRALDHKDLSLRELTNVVSILHERTETEPILLKGFSVERFYPDPYKRWMQDVDLMLPDIESALATYEWLCDIGYAVDQNEISWFKKYEGCLYGQITMYKAFDNDYTRFDIHYGRYSVSYSGFYDDDLWANNTCIDLNGTRLQVLTPERCLLLVFAHMLSSGFVSMKDLNDTTAIMLANDLDWLDIVRVAKQNLLEPVMYRTVKHLQNLYDHPPLLEKTEQLHKQLTKPLFGTRIWHIHNGNWSLRALINSRYTYQFERKQGGIIYSARVAFECFLYYMRRLRVVLRPRKVGEAIAWLFLSKPLLLAGVVNRQTCVRLVKLPFAGILSLPCADSSHVLHYVYCDKKLVYFEDRGIGVFVSRRHVYIPTIDYIFASEDVDAALDLCRRLCGDNESRKAHRRLWVEDNTLRAAYLSR